MQRPDAHAVEPCSGPDASTVIDLLSDDEIEELFESVDLLDSGAESDVVDLVNVAPLELVSDVRKRPPQKKNASLANSSKTQGSEKPKGPSASPLAENSEMVEEDSVSTPPARSTTGSVEMNSASSPKEDLPVPVASEAPSLPDPDVNASISGTACQAMDSTSCEPSSAPIDTAVNMDNSIVTPPPFSTSAHQDDSPRRASEVASMCPVMPEGPSPSVEPAIDPVTSSTELADTTSQVNVTSKSAPEVGVRPTLTSVTKSTPEIDGKLPPASETEVKTASAPFNLTRKSSNMYFKILNSTLYKKRKRSPSPRLKSMSTSISFLADAISQTHQQQFKIKSTSNLVRKTTFLPKEQLVDNRSAEGTRDSVKRSPRPEAAQGVVRRRSMRVRHVSAESPASSEEKQGDAMSFRSSQRVQQGSLSPELKQPHKKKKLPKPRGANTARKSSVPVDDSKGQQPFQSERVPSPPHSSSSSEPSTLVHSLSKRRWGRSELSGRRAIKEFVTFVSSCVRTHLDKIDFEPDQFYTVPGCMSCILAVGKDAVLQSSACGEESQHIYFVLVLTNRCHLWLLVGRGSISSSAPVNEASPLPLAQYATLLGRQKRYRQFCSTLKDSNLLKFHVSGLEDELMKRLPLPNLLLSSIGFAFLQTLERDQIEASCHAVANCISRLTQYELPPPPSVCTAKARDRPLWCYEGNLQEEKTEPCPFCGLSFSSTSMPHGLWAHLKKHEEEFRRRVSPSIVQDHMQKQLASNLRLRSVIEKLHIETADLSNQYKLL